MKYKQAVIEELEKARQLSESIKKGMDNRTISPQEVYDLNLRVYKHVSNALKRVGLEYDETR